MDTILENPLSVGLIGAVVAGLIGFVAIQTNQWKLLYPTGGVAALTLLLVVASVSIETEREQVIRTIEEVAEAVRNNQPKQALAHIHPNAQGTLRNADQELARYHFYQANVTSIREVTVNYHTHPMTATSQFVAHVKVSGQHQLSGVPVSAMRLVKIYWMKQGDRWLVRDYEHDDARSAFFN